MKATAEDPGVLARELAAVARRVFMHASPDFVRGMLDLDVTFPQLVALSMLELHEEGMQVTDFAAALHVSVPTASRGVDCLHRRGFVERHEDPSDRRVRRVRITDAGREVIGRLHATRVSALEELIATLTDADRRALAAALAPLARDDVRRRRATPCPKGPTPE